MIYYIVVTIHYNICDNPFKIEHFNGFGILVEKDAYRYWEEKEYSSHLWWLDIDLGASSVEFSFIDIRIIKVYR